MTSLIFFQKEQLIAHVLWVMQLRMLLLRISGQSSEVQ